MSKRKSARVAEVATKKAKLAEPSLKFDLQWQQARQSLDKNIYVSFIPSPIPNPHRREKT